MAKSKKCKSCKFRAPQSVPWDCDYISITGSMRGCEAGSECTKYKRGARIKTLYPNINFQSVIDN